MSEVVVIDAEKLHRLNDQHWRRLGVTETFPRLLVEAAALGPGAPLHVRNLAGRNLQGPAAKFWELTFDKVKQDLCRKGLLQEGGGTLRLGDDFADRLLKLLNDQGEGVSHVEPTPGVTLEDIARQQQTRDEREKVKKAAARKSAGPKKAAGAKGAPRKRGAAAAAEAEATAPRVPSAPPMAQPAVAATASSIPPATKVFTTNRVQKLLDHLDNNTLNRVQVGQRLDIGGAELKRFLEVAAHLEIVRVDRDEIIELHWKGRELARTTGVDRRRVVHDLVRDLRNAAGDMEEEGR